jgi:hypothetical protein
MAAAAARVYTISLTRVSVTGAITLIQIKTGAQCPAQLMRVRLGQTSSTTSTQQSVQLNRKVTTPATVTGFTPLTNGPITDAAAQMVNSTTGTGTNASAEGTDGNIIDQDVWNFLNGWLFLPTPKEYPFIDAFIATTQGLLALKLPVAPGSATTFTADMLVEELA